MVTTEQLLAYRDALRLSRSDNADEVPWQNRLAESTVPLYSEVQASWEAFKGIFKDPNVDFLNPDTDTLKTFFFWYAANSKGRISELSSLSTLLWKVGRFGCMFRRVYKTAISEEALEAVRIHIRGPVKESLHLSDQEYPKEVASWRDVAAIIRFIIAEDNHNYFNNRFRLQVVLFLLLMSEDGERMGAITRSETYRKTNDALAYQDVQVFLRPALLGHNAQFQLRITFNLRKNERGDPKKFIVLDYFQRDDRAHCIVLWVLALAFLDNAFEDFSTPAELFNARNCTTSNIPVRIRKSLLPIPIMRRMEGIGERRLSPTLAWTAGSALNELQRVAFMLGLVGVRFTSYCIRRGVNNEISDNCAVPDARRKQLMGHTGPSDKVFRKYYQSRLFTIDTGNLFRKEAPRQEKSDALCMSLQQVPNAPRKLPPPLKAQIQSGDNALQSLAEARKALKAELDRIRGSGDSDREYDRVTVVAALEGNWKAICRRRSALVKEGLGQLRESFCKSGSRNVPYRESVLRPELVHVLYPDSEAAASVVTAVECLIAHAIRKDHDQKNQDDKNGQAAAPAASRKIPFTSEEDALLRELKGSNLPWKVIAESFPRRPTSCLRTRYAKITAGEGPPRKRGRPATCSEEGTPLPNKRRKTIRGGGRS